MLTMLYEIYKIRADDETLSFVKNPEKSFYLGDLKDFTGQDIE